MTTPDDPGPPAEDVDAWLEEMSGRRPASNAASRVLRDAMQRDRTAAIDRELGDAASPEAEQRALERLRAARAKLQATQPVQPMPDALPVVRPPGAVASNAHRWRMVASLGVLLIAVGGFWQLRPQGEGDFVIADSGGPVWRDLTEPPRIAVPEPAKAAQALAKAVAPFDSLPALFREGETVLVDFNVQPGQAAELTEAVADARIRPLIHLGANRIIFAREPR